MDGAWLSMVTWEQTEISGHAELGCPVLRLKEELGQDARVPWQRSAAPAM
jgi:hypothetical protein